MSESPEEIEKKIKTWLVEEYFDSDIVLVPNSNVFFQIRITNKKAGPAALPSYFTLTKNEPDKILVSFYWQVHEMQIKSINALKEDARKTFKKKLAQGFLLMHLDFRPEPSMEDIQKIKVIDRIFLDGLTKHAIINSLTKINCAHGYVLSLFDLIMDQGFDPYKEL